MNPYRNANDLLEELERSWGPLVLAVRVFPSGRHYQTYLRQREVVDVETAIRMLTNKTPSRTAVTEDDLPVLLSRWNPLGGGGGAG